MTLKTALSYGPLLVVAAAVLWALDGLLRRSLYSLDPLVIVFYEHLIGSLLLIPAFLKEKKFDYLLSTVGLVLIVSLFSGLLGTLWFTTALIKVNFIPFSVVLLLQKLQPIFATSSAALLLKEKVTKKYMIWAGVALVAAYFVTFKNGVVNLSPGNQTLQAALFAVGAAVAWGTSTSFSKLLLNRVSSTTATALRFFATTILAFIACTFWLPGDAIMNVTVSQLLRFGLIALSTGMVALYLYYKGLQTTQAKVATILELVFPVLGVIIDAVVFKSFLGPTQLIAAAVLLFSVIKTAQLNKTE
jgi:drug/metabolite transporter (DMT)-like permease